MQIDDQAILPVDHGLPEKKRTALGLYATAAEAYEMWRVDPARANIIDVRTPEEYIFVGHAPMARNIPVGFIEYQWDVEKGEPVFTVNAAFGSKVKALYGATDMLMLMCRSGGRSALAVNALAQAGFENVYNITDGMEGDVVAEEGSLFLGKRMKNGWKNSGLPWTYDGDPDLLWIDMRGDEHE